MLDLRLKAWRFFEEIPWPTGAEETWRRTKLTGFKFEEYQPVSGADRIGGPAGRGGEEPGRDRERRRAGDRRRRDRKVRA